MIKNNTWYSAVRKLIESPNEYIEQITKKIVFKKKEIGFNYLVKNNIK